MSKFSKKTILFLLILIGLFIAGIVGGIWINQKYFPTVIENPVIVKEVLEYDNPELIEEAIKEASERHGIYEEVLGDY